MGASYLVRGTATAPAAAGMMDLDCCCTQQRAAMDQQDSDAIHGQRLGGDDAMHEREREREKLTGLPLRSEAYVSAAR
ncbi:hypothetical protein MUK42_12255 [Musa troglodytarum]|uniref:Uncharacterized protein n=1 Tax=Musa troglodytarum TaxID=320322 RepID=A0A9E7H5S2_9LILI|nr:hypothetical protein MUK42_12255 [Musa troglodytarum]